MGKYENETIIRWDESEDRAIIYSSSPNFIRKMDGLCAKGIIELKRDYGDGKEWNCDKKMVNVRPKKRMSEETRKAHGDRLRAMRNAGIDSTVSSPHVHREL